MHAGAPPPARSKELSSGPSSSQLARRRGREAGCGDGGEVGGEERVRQLPGDHRLRHDPPLRAGGRGRGLGRRDLFGRRLDAEVPHHLPLERPGRVGDAGVLGEQRQQPSVPDGGRREDGRDAVQALELLGPVTVASAAAARTRARSSRSSRATAWNFVRTAGVTRPRRAAASTSRTVRASTETTSPRCADAPLLPRGGTASARLALAWSSHKLLLRNAGHGGRGSMPHSPIGRDEKRPEHEGLVLRTPSRPADLQGSTQLATASVSRGPGAAGGWAGDHNAGKPSSDDRFGSRVS